METTKKTCFKCQESKPLSEFYRHSRMGDGHLNKCKECTKKDVSNNRINKIEYYRSFDKRRASNPNRVLARNIYRKTEAGKDAFKRAHKNWAIKHPERKKASQIVANAVRDKKLTKQPCFICGHEKVEAHHPVYSMPLDVVWLCVRHHKMTHAMANEYLKAA